MFRRKPLLAKSFDHADFTLPPSTQVRRCRRLLRVIVMVAASNVSVVVSRSAGPRAAIAAQVVVVATAIANHHSARAASSAELPACLAARLHSLKAIAVVIVHVVSMRRSRVARRRLYASRAAASLRRGTSSAWRSRQPRSGGARGDAGSWNTERRRVRALRWRHGPGIAPGELRPQATCPHWTEQGASSTSVACRRLVAPQLPA